MALDRFLVLSAFVGVAGVKRVAHPFEHLVIELKPTEQVGELRFKVFLADIFPSAGVRIAFALISVAGAMIIDVAFLLDLADHRATAGMARNQPREGEVVSAALGLLPEAAVEGALHTLPGLDGHQRLVLALDELAVPSIPARIKPVAQDRVNRAQRYLGATLRIEQTRRMRLARCFLQ
jgi:hypothetical protein